MSELVAGAFGFWIGGCAATGASIFAGLAVRRRLGIALSRHWLMTVVLNLAFIVAWPISVLWAQWAIERGDIDLDV